MGISTHIEKINCNARGGGVIRNKGIFAIKTIVFILDLLIRIQILLVVVLLLLLLILLVVVMVVVMVLLVIRN